MSISAQANAQLTKFMHRIAQSAEEAAADDRLAPRYTKPGTLDLTASRLFIEKVELHVELCAIVRAHAHTPLQWNTDRRIMPHAAVQMLLTSFRSIHACWRMSTPITPDQFREYQSHVVKFAQVWQVFHWKSTVWVHWTVAHSGTGLPFKNDPPARNPPPSSPDR